MAPSLSKEEAEILKNKGKMFHFPLFTVYLDLSDEGKGAFSVAVSKKEAKLSVDRNRIKRRIRSAFSKKQPNFPIKALFFGRRPVLKASFSDIVKDVENVLIKFNKNKI